MYQSLLWVNTSYFMFSLKFNQSIILQFKLYTKLNNLTYCTVQSLILDLEFNISPLILW